MVFNQGDEQVHLVPLIVIELSCVRIPEMLEENVTEHHQV